MSRLEGISNLIELIFFKLFCIDVLISSFFIDSTQQFPFPLPCPASIIYSKLLNLSEPKFGHLWNGDSDAPSSQDSYTEMIGSLMWMLLQYLKHSTRYSNVSCYDTENSQVSSST